MHRGFSLLDCGWRNDCLRVYAHALTPSRHPARGFGVLAVAAAMLDGCSPGRAYDGYALLEVPQQKDGISLCQCYPGPDINGRSATFRPADRAQAWSMPMVRNANDKWTACDTGRVYRLDVVGAGGSASFGPFNRAELLVAGVSFLAVETDETSVLAIDQAAASSLLDGLARDSFLSGGAYRDSVDEDLDWRGVHAVIELVHAGKYRITMMDADGAVLDFDALKARGAAALASKLLTWREGKDKVILFRTTPIHTGTRERGEPPPKVYVDYRETYPPAQRN